MLKQTFEDRCANRRQMQATALFLLLATEIIRPDLAPLLLFAICVAPSLFEQGFRLGLPTTEEEATKALPLICLSIGIEAAAFSGFGDYFWKFGGYYGRMLAMGEWCAVFVHAALTFRLSGRMAASALAGVLVGPLLIPLIGAPQGGLPSDSPSMIALAVVAGLLAVSQVAHVIRQAALERKLLVQRRNAAELDRAFTNSIVENVPNLLFVVDAKTRRHVLVNKAAERLSGIDKDQLIGAGYDTLYPVEDAERVRALDDEALTSTAPVPFEDQKFVSKDGQTHLLRGRRVSVRDDKGDPRYIIGVAEDVTEIREAEAQVRKLAHYDSLTELPNRVLFRSRLYEAFNEASAGQSRSALLWIDLDYFKEVNDTLGHLVGDHLLIGVAERLLASVRLEDTVARLGGDEFAVVQRGLESREDAIQLAKRLVETLSQPFHLQGRDVTIGASIGIAFAPEDGLTVDELMMHADMALYRCKEMGRGGYFVYDPAMDEKRRARRAMEQDLRQAFERGDFSVVYQPQLHLDSGRISGCEALLRWNRDGKPVSPAEFIPVAEDIGLIIPLGEWVLREACKEAAKWPAPMKVAVNISPAQFKDLNLIRTVISALAQAGLSADRLEVEITESTLLQGNQNNLTTLFRLRELGVSVGLDDFGTGFSSLNYLRQFPFTKIKIDRSFISDLSMSVESVSIVRAIAGLARNLGMQTTAEGVETQRQLEIVKEYGCTEVQGFLISRPIAPKDLMDVFDFYGGADQTAVSTGDAELWLAVG